MRPSRPRRGVHLFVDGLHTGSFSRRREGLSLKLSENCVSHLQFTLPE